MKALYDLKETLTAELEEIARKPEMSAGDLDAVHKLTDTIKNIDKICMIEEGGYSEDGYSRDNGSSYARRKRDSMGRYSRDGYPSNRMNDRGGYRGNYSRDDGKEHMISMLEDMMSDADNERTQSAIRKCINEIERD